MRAAAVKFGVLVISHGSRNAEWVRLVDEAVGGAGLAKDVPVVSSFLELVEGRLIQDGLDALEAAGVTDVAVVPLFVSSGSTHVDEIMWALGLREQARTETELTRFRVAARLHECPPIDDDPDIAEIVYEKVVALSVQPERETLLLVGHGSKEKGFHADWRRGLEGLARRVAERGGFGAWETAMLLPNQLPCKLAALRKRQPERAIVVAPLFISDGYFTRVVIPERLNDFDVRYAGAAMLPHPRLSRWIGRQAEHAAAKLTASEAGERGVRQHGETSETHL